MFASLATSAFGKPVEDEKIGNYGSRLAPKWKNQRDGKGNHLLSSKHQCLEPQNGHRRGWIPLLWLQPPEIFLSFTLCCILPLEGAALCWNRVCFGLCSPERWECDQSLQVWSVCLQRPVQSLPVKAESRSMFEKVQVTQDQIPSIIPSHGQGQGTVYCKNTFSPTGFQIDEVQEFF